MKSPKKPLAALCYGSTVHPGDAEEAIQTACSDRSFTAVNLRAAMNPHPHIRWYRENITEVTVWQYSDLKIVEVSVLVIGIDAGTNCKLLHTTCSCKVNHRVIRRIAESSESYMLLFVFSDGS